MWNLVVAFFFTHVLFQAFSVSLQLSYFLNSLCFFYTQSCQVEGQVLGNSTYILSVTLSKGKESLVFYLPLPSKRWWWWVNLINIQLLIWFPTINSASCFSLPSHPLYSYFYPKETVLPKFGIIII